MWCVLRKSDTFGQEIKTELVIDMTFLICKNKLLWMFFCHLKLSQDVTNIIKIDNLQETQIPQKSPHPLFGYFSVQSSAQFHLILVEDITVVVNWQKTGGGGGGGRGRGPSIEDGILLFENPISAPWAPSRVDMCALHIFIIIIIIISKIPCLFLVSIDLVYVISAGYAFGDHQNWTSVHVCVTCPPI